MKSKSNSKRKSHRIRLFIMSLKEQMLRKHNGTFLLYMILRALVIVTGILAFIGKRYESVAVCILVLILFLVPSFLERRLRFSLPSAFEKIILLFIFSAEILGELQSFYLRFAWWDTMLHTLNGFLCAAVGFALVDLLNNNPDIRLSLSPFYLAATAFCFSMTVGVIWEFFEFSMDTFLGLDMQKDTVIHTIRSVKLNPSGQNVPYVIKGIRQTAVNGELLMVDGYLDIGLIDTMKDLLVNFVGAVVFSVIGYCYVKSRGKNRFASRFIPVRNPEEGEMLSREEPERKERKQEERGEKRTEDPQDSAEKKT